MSEHAQDAPNESTLTGDKTWVIARFVLASVLAALGFILLVATKTTAGSAFICSAVLLFLPFGRLTDNKWLSIAPRVAVIVVLCTIAIRSIANTDIVPGRATTGYRFGDQVSAILQRFQENIFRSEAVKEGHEKGAEALRSPRSTPTEAH